MAGFSFVKQAVNLPALRQLANVLRNPSLLVPHLSLNSIADLNAEVLQSLKSKQGVRCVIFDKDNTLSLCYVDELHATAREAVAQSQVIFGTKAVAILSNSVGSSDDENYSAALATEKSMGLVVIRHRQKKPACLTEVLQHFESTGALAGLKAKECCMVGDRVLTDVLFANLNGMTSVLVAPVCIRTDHPIAVLIRAIERRLLLPFVRLLGFTARRRR